MERYGIEIKYDKFYTLYYVKKRGGKVIIAANPTCAKWYLNKKVAEKTAEQLKNLYGKEVLGVKLVTLDSKGTIR